MRKSAAILPLLAFQVFLNLTVGPLHMALFHRSEAQTVESTSTVSDETGSFHKSCPLCEFQSTQTVFTDTTVLKQSPDLMSQKTAEEGQAVASSPLLFFYSTRAPPV